MPTFEKSVFDKTSTPFSDRNGRPVCLSSPIERIITSTGRVDNVDEETRAVRRTSSHAWPINDLTLLCRSALRGVHL